MYTLDDTNTLRKYIISGIDEFPSQLGDTLLLETAIKALQDSKQPINVNVTMPEIKQADINIAPPNVTFNAPEPAQITIINEDKKGKAQEDFNKTLRKIANGK